MPPSGTAAAPDNGEEITSLDRFVIQHLPGMSGLSAEAFAGRALRIMSLSYGATGLLMAAIGVIASLGGARDALWTLIPAGVLGFTSAFTASLGTVLRWRAKEGRPATVRLTPEASELSRRLMQHLAGTFFFRHPKLRHVRRVRSHNLPGMLQDRRSEDELSQAAFRLLDAAAFQYNRIYGLLALSSHETSADGTTLDRLGPSIRAAAEETMAELLHVAAMIERSPETTDALETEGQERIRELQELAGEVDRLRAATQSSTAQLEGPTRIRSILDELRAEQAARADLSATQEVSST